MAILQKRVFSFGLTWVVLGVLLCSASAANAQPWKKLGTLPTAMYCAYFFDSTHGVVAGVGTIWRYNNGSWSNPSIEPTGTVSYFSSIRMLKPGVLYATSGDTYVWYSTDSGATWQNTTTPGGFAL